MNRIWQDLKIKINSKEMIKNTNETQTHSVMYDIVGVFFTLLLMHFPLNHFGLN